MNKNIITGVLMAAIFVIIAFVPASDNMHTIQSNTATGNISPQVSNKNGTNNHVEGDTL